jgi:CHAT domain-containing protein
MSAGPRAIWEQHPCRREVAALRCGLDLAAWAEGSNCSKLLGVSLTTDDLQPGKPLPFDLARAHALYKALFGEVEGLIKGKHLLIVPSGALTRLPFQVLVTQAPDANVTGAQALRKSHWLIRDHALTVLPSVSSLIALRERAKASRATKAMIGFGNPVVEGDESHTSSVPFLLLSREAVHYRQNCALPLSDGEKRLYAGLGTLGATSLDPISTAEQIRRADPIPAMGFMLCEMAHEPGFEDSRVLLANQATKTNLMELNRTGELAKYRIVHFATHGALAGDVIGSTEPGLVLTPPDKETPDDTGYLSASDITQLKLDADWVILSACNTAAGEQRGGEALSGLARAFFYAQARALLVSYRNVYVSAAVRLVGQTTRAFAVAKVDRAQALRRAMLVLIDTGKDYEVQPAYWAPFVLVGEGAAGNFTSVGLNPDSYQPHPTWASALRQTPLPSFTPSVPVPDAGPVRPVGGPWEQGWFQHLPECWPICGWYWGIKKALDFSDIQGGGRWPALGSMMPRALPWRPDDTPPYHAGGQ